MDNMEKFTEKAGLGGLVVMGAICGDIIGSFYEFRATKDHDFPLFTWKSSFTDDTVCTVALADALSRGEEYAGSLRLWCRKYPRAGYGGWFQRWFREDDAPAYNSYGNGSAMRVSAAGAYARSLGEALELAKKSAEITHNHPEGIKGAQAVAAAIYYARKGKSKTEIKEIVEELFGYDLNRTIEEMRPGYRFDVSCQGSVPESIICFLESTDYEDAVRNAVSMGGDADTMGAIAGGIAAAYYKEIPAKILDECLSRLPEEMKETVTAFGQAAGLRSLS